MRVVNRTAVTVTGIEPYVEWTRQTASDAGRGLITVAHAKLYGTAYLLPEFELEEDLLEWVEENFVWLFEFQLSAWSEDEATWPSVRDLAAFRRWFRLDIQNVVVDVGDDDIEGEEL
jgi:hypothetical protein